MSRTIQVGLFVPVEEYGYNGGTAGWQELAAYARQADGLGYDSLWLADHFIFRDDTTDPPQVRGAWEAMSLMAAIAAVTNKVEVGTLVACTQFRNPAMTAKMAETMDEISSGRIVLGIGAGWNEPEFTAYGYPFDHRIDRFEEALQIIHSLLKTGHADFSGAYYKVDNCELRPRGPRAEGPPIMIGSVRPRMLGLTARYADRWNGEWWNVGKSVPGLVETMSRVDAACEAADRDPATLHRSLFVPFDMGTGTHGDSMGAIEGDSARFAEFLNELAEIGIDEAQVWLDDQSPAGLERFAPVLEMITS